MVDPQNFRKINNIEKDIIFTSISDISSKLLPIIENLEKSLYISLEKLAEKNDYPKIYLISNELSKIIDKLNENDNIVFGGLYFGFIKKGRFFLSLEGVEFLYKNNIFSDFKKLYVNGKGEKSILYGNDILKSMIIKSPSNLKKDDFLVIFNELKEIIALGRSLLGYENIQILKPNEIIAINLSDKGLYLRKKQ